MGEFVPKHSSLRYLISFVSVVGAFRAVWDGKERRRLALEDVAPPVKKSMKKRRKRQKKDAGRHGHHRRGPAFAVPKRAYLPATRPQSAPSQREQIAFEAAVKEQCVEISARRATRAIIYNTWVPPLANVETAEAHNADVRAFAPAGRAFFTPGGLERPKTAAREGADGAGEQRVYIDKRHKRHKHLGRGDAGPRRRPPRSDASVVSRGSTACGSGSVRSHRSRAHTAHSSSASSSNARARAHGRGGVHVPWDMTVTTDSPISRRGQRCRY